MLIVIEGLDGSGKSTQVKRLRDCLEREKGPVDYLHFPRYDAPVYGELIATFLQGGFGAIDKVHPRLVALLYAEDRHEAASRMRRSLAEGKILLLDRYVYSNIAYQCAKVADEAEREALRKWILELEYGRFGLPVPDLNVFMDVPVDFVEEKLSASRQGEDRDYLCGGPTDIHEADIDFQRKVKAVYVRQAALDPRFIRVDCADAGGRRMAGEEIVSERIRKVVLAAFEKQERKNEQV